MNKNKVMKKNGENKLLNLKRVVNIWSRNWSSMIRPTVAYKESEQV